MTGPLTIRRATLSCVLLLGMAALPAEAARWPDWAEPTSSTYTERHGGEDAVVLLDEWDIVLQDGQRRGTRRWAIHVLTEDGRQHASQWLAGGAFGRYENVRFWVRQPNGKTKKYSHEDGTLFGTADRKILDDTEVLVFAPPDVAPGTRVAFEARFVRTDDLPQDMFTIRQEVPVIRSSVHVDARGGWSVQSALFDGDDPTGGVATTEATWEFLDVPGLKSPDEWLAPEPPRTQLVLNYLPPGGQSPFRDWSSTARWGLALQGLTAAGSSPQLAEVAARLRDEEGDPIDAVAGFARSLRYFGIELGWGGYRPRDPTTTLARAFGDCKDKSVLMVALLRELGIEALQVLAVNPSHRYVPEELPSPFHFNHSIVGIPWHDREVLPGMAIADAPGVGPLRLLDPTLSEASALDIAISTEDGVGLVLDPRTTGPLRFATSGEAENLREEVERWTLTSDGRLHARVAVRNLGVLRARLESAAGETLDLEELRKLVVARLGYRSPGSDEVVVEPIAREPDGAWSYGYAYANDDPLASFGDFRMLEYGTLAALSRIRVPDQDRQEPAFRPYRVTYRHVVQVATDGARVLRAPEGFSIENGLGSVELEVREDEDGLVVRRELTLTEKTVMPDRAEEAHALRRALRRANTAALVLEAVDATRE